MERRAINVRPGGCGPGGRLGRRDGVALIFALITIALLTVIILAFFSRALLNRQLSFTTTNEVRADLFAHAALNVVVGEIREEIRNGSTSLNGGNSSYPSIYLPNTTADVVLKRSGVDGSASLPIAKVSASGLGLYPAEGSAAAGRTLGSSVSVSTPSANGRYISSTTWFGAAGPNLGTQSTLPTWVFVTRDNGIEVPTLPNARDPTQPDYVIGRFAYTVYDIGGLLNANVAGYPSIDTTDAPYKGSQAFADLTQIPGLSTPDMLVNWRNGSDAASAAAYSSYVSAYGEPNGFLSTKIGDNAFLSRHDLLNFLEQNMGLSAGSTPCLALTPFSRSLNAPCWGPVADATSMGGSGSLYAYNTNANTSTGAPFSAASPNPNRFLPNVRLTVGGTITHYRDDGTTQTYAAAAGDVLVQRRFSLAKLAWLTSSGPAAGISAKAIQSCFGLQWQNSPVYGLDNSVLTGYGWVYIGSTVTPTSTPTALAKIETLDQVAAEGREPNFFELLQAGILSGVVGVNNKDYLAGSTPATALPSAVQASTFLHILTIGANVIDQYKADSYPTILIGTYNGAQDMVTGTKALPMIQGYMDMAGANPTTSTNLSVYLTVNLWNPYVLPTGGSTGTVPNVRIHVQGGYTQNDGWAPAAGAPTSNPATSFQLPLAPPADGWAQLSNASGAYATAGPVLASTVSSKSGWSTVPTVAGGKMLGYQFPDVPTSSTRQTLVSQNDIASASPEYLQNYLGTSSNPFNIVAEFQTASGSWVPYSYLDGINDSLTWRTGMVHWVNNSFITSAVGGAYTPKAFSSTQAEYGPFDFKIDPRSTRFNEMQWSCSTAPAVTTLPFLPLSFLSVAGFTASISPNEQYIPQLISGGAATLTSAPFFSPGSLAFNNGGGTAGTYNSYLDLDGIRRLADYGLFTGDTWANTPFGSSVAGTPTAQTPANSPVILNRPFRSVGELGYTFTDLPWRSINFIDHHNAYGGLLEIFSLTDEPAVVDDRVNLNASQSTVMQSLLSGTAQAPDGTLPLSQAGSLASAYNAYAFSAPGTPTASLPITAGQLTDFLYSLGVSDGLDQVKPHREAVVRALAGSTQSRTWNVLVDVVAQVGRYGATAASLNDFIVEGEKRYWLSVAIDRYTGKIIAQSLEPAYE